MLSLFFPILSMSFIFIIWGMTWWSLLLPQLAWYQSDPPARETPVISHSSPVCHRTYQFTTVSKPVLRLSLDQSQILFRLFYSVSILESRCLQGHMVNFALPIWLESNQRQRYLEAGQISSLAILSGYTWRLTISPTPPWLKVPSHQIRLAWKWYCWIGLINIWTADGKRIF